MILREADPIEVDEMCNADFRFTGLVDDWQDRFVIVNGVVFRIDPA